MRAALLVWLLSLAATPAVHGPNEVAILGCQKAATTKLRAMRTDSDAIKFAPGPRVESADRSVRVAGAGVYQDRLQGDWHRFTYSCTYNARKAEARAIVQIDGAASAAARHRSKRLH